MPYLRENIYFTRQIPAAPEKVRRSISEFIFKYFECVFKKTKKCHACHNIRENHKYFRMYLRGIRNKGKPVKV